jgi:DNA-binding CsgD family transcriptional regulator/N-acetylneuraminic acid mutarotase
MPEANETLSERELEILRLVATGAANKEIARQLVISPNTVKVHLRNIFAKIGVSSRTEATLYAVQVGLVKTAAAQEEPAESSNGTGEITPLPELTIEGAPAEPVSTARRRWRFTQIAGAVLVALVLIAAGIAGSRLIASGQNAVPTVVSQSSTPALTAQRWTTGRAIPAPRKGMGITEYEDSVYLLAGLTAQGADGSVLRYTPANNEWQALASKPTPVGEVQSALLGEKIYVPGGLLASGKSTDRLEVYNPRQNTWEVKAPLPQPVSAYALAAFEGRLYLFGGKNGDQYLATTFVYDPQEDHWETRTPMSAPRAYAGAAVVGGKIHVIGGYDGTHALKINEAYFPPRDGSGEKPWEDFASLPQGRYAMGAANLTGIIYLLGGLDEQGKPAEPGALQYIAQSNRWMVFDTPPAPVGALPALLASGNFLYILGGETAGALSASNQSYQAIYTISVPMLGNGNP